VRPPRLGEDRRARLPLHAAGPDLPFSLAALLALASQLLTLPIERPAFYVAGAIGTLILVASLTLVPWQRLRAKTKLAVPLLYFAVVALLRHGDGGAASGYAILAMLPILWFALEGTVRELGIAVVVLGLTLSVPHLTFGPPDYPESQLRQAGLYVTVAAVVGTVTQRLVAHQRRLIDETSELLELVRQLASTDPLTGLGNRRALDERVEAIARGSAPSPGMAIAFVDLDHFKAYNDKFGHYLGDALLRSVAEAWSKVVRPGDFITRHGGDEFVVVLPGCSLEDAREIAARLHRALPARQTCSIGLAYSDGGEAADDVLRRAVVALHEAKRLGRNRVVSA